MKVENLLHFNLQVLHMRPMGFSLDNSWYTVAICSEKNLGPFPILSLHEWLLRLGRPKINPLSCNICRVCARP